MQHLDTALGSNQRPLTGEFYLGEGDVLDDTFTDVEFYCARVSGGSLSASRFENCTFENATFENVCLEHVDFHCCHFKNFKMLNCGREGMEMEGCTGSPPTMISTT